MSCQRPAVALSWSGRTRWARQEVVGTVETVGRWLFVAAVPEVAAAKNRHPAVHDASEARRLLLVDASRGRDLTRTINDEPCSDFLILAWCLKRKISY